MNIEEKLDQLAEFYSQKDALDLRKRELLNEIQVPAEIEQIVKNGMARISAVDEDVREASKAFDAKIDAKLAAIIVPQEYQDELAAIDRARAEILAKMDEVEAQKRAIRNEQSEQHAAMFAKVSKLKQDIQAETEAQTRGVYDAINQRKQEIEIEFNYKADDAQANIQKLEAEIKADMKRQAAEKLEADPKAKDLSVKGKYFHAVYVRGRVTWNTDKMDAWCNDHPFLMEARKEGEPSITLRRI